MPFEFERPEVLYLLLLLLPWVLLAWPRAERGVLFSRGESVRLLEQGWLARSGVLRALPDLIRGATLACAVVALAGPQQVGVVRETSQLGKAVVLAVDLSTSMLAEDMDGQSRLDVARDAAIRFARRRTLDELSLVGFGGQAFTRIPLTTDPNLIVAGVESLKVELVRNGTDISGAIITSVNRLLESERRGRVIVLLTDGAHNAAGVLPLATAQAAAAHGIKIHSISLISPAQMSGSGSPAAEGSEPAVAGTILSAASAISGGRYFQAASPSALDSIYTEIDRIEAPAEGTIQLATVHPLRVWFLASALLLLVLMSALHGSRLGVVP